MNTVSQPILHHGDPVGLLGVLAAAGVSIDSDDAIHDQLLIFCSRLLLPLLAIDHTIGVLLSLKADETHSTHGLVDVLPSDHFSLKSYKTFWLLFLFMTNIKRAAKITD